MVIAAVGIGIVAFAIDDGGGAVAITELQRDAVKMRSLGFYGVCERVNFLWVIENRVEMVASLRRIVAIKQRLDKAQFGGVLNALRRVVQRDGAAFFLITVQKTWRGMAMEDMGDLPSEIMSVADAGV